MAGFLGAKPVILSTTAATVGGNMTVSGTSTLGDDVTITGEIDVDSVTDGTTSVPTGYVVNGSAKAWVNFNGGGTVAIRDSLNVASLTDNGVGDYTVNFSNSLGAGYYPTLSATVYNVAFPRSTGITGSSDALGSSIRFINGYSNPIGTAVPEDPDFVGMSAHGDLA